MPLKLTLPPDLEARLPGLEQAIAASCPGVLFVYVFGSAAIGTVSPRTRTPMRRSSRWRVLHHDS